nr:MAG TPA: hypothetical protein [Caudoviricetes sp.]
MRYNSVLISELCSIIIVRISELVNDFCTDFKIFFCEVCHV